MPWIQTAGRVTGHCPMGCGPHLHLAADSRVTCYVPTCPNPTAAATLLDDPVTEHLVTVTATGFTIRHPLRERIGTELEDCALHQHLGRQWPTGPSVPPGRYLAALRGDAGWTFTAVDPEGGHPPDGGP